MRYEINGNITTVYDSKGDSFVIDTDQLGKVLKYNWYVDNRKGYVRTASRKIKRIPLHRYLLGVESTVDHINRNPRDNRLSNLRLCTLQENNLNKGVRKDSKSGVKGISIEQNKKSKYKARIQFNGRRITIGYFQTMEEAECAYKEKARELFGEYAPD